MTFAFFALEFVVISVVLIGLFRQRLKIGMYGVVMAVASLQMIQSILGASFYWEVVPEVFVSPGSAILFASNLAILLVAYTFGGTRDARTILYTVVGANVFIALVGVVVYFHIELAPPQNFNDVPPELFASGVKSTLVGICVLYLDQLLAILLYAFLQTKVPRLPHLLRYTSVLVVVLMFDTLLFVSVMFAGSEQFIAVLKSGLISKAVAGLVFGLVWGVALRPKRSIGDDTLREVLAGLFFMGDTERLRELALKDPLTGLYNRRYYEMCFDILVESIDASDYQFALVVFDIDRFKQVNDAIGHAGGDKVLMDLSEATLRAIRADDMAFRIGGDEFVILLPDTDREGALVVADRLRRARVRHARLDAPVTVTIGVACFPEDGTDREALFEAADKRLYAGKDGGRNQIVSG